MADNHQTIPIAPFPPIGKAPDRPRVMPGIQASHLESLHPHDAVAIVTKGIPGGLQP